MSDIEKRVAKVVVDQLGKGDLKEEDIKPESSFIDDLKADSLDTVELVMGFEEEFGISISDEVAQEIRTVGDVITLVEERLAEDS